MSLHSGLGGEVTILSLGLDNRIHAHSVIYPDCFEDFDSSIQVVKQDCSRYLMALYFC